MQYLLDHTTLGFCWWDIPALIVLAAVILYFIYRTRQQKDEIQDLEYQISALQAEEVLEEAESASEVTE